MLLLQNEKNIVTFYAQSSAFIFYNMHTYVKITYLFSRITYLSKDDNEIFISTDDKIQASRLPIRLYSNISNQSIWH